MLRVLDVMTTWPVSVDADIRVIDAGRLAESWGVHHLLVTSDQELVGVICRCDMAEAADFELVSRRMNSPFVFVNPRASVEAAAETMIAQGVGCLPVLDELGQLVGVVTRRDLRVVGALPGSPGFDACAACGETHSLRRPSRGGSVVFCGECLERSLSRGDHAVATVTTVTTVTTLGGSG